MNQIELRVGDSSWSVRIPKERLVTVQPSAPIAAPLADLRAAVWDALENPYHLNFPMRRALTPDDRVALVIDERLPQLGALLTEVLRYLASAGIGPESVTIVTESSTGSQDWIDELPDEFADVHTENHQAGDRKQLSYLSSTKKGRRVYLNRTLVDADQIVTISGRRYDPLLGYAGCEGSLFPGLSDEESRHATWGEFTANSASPDASGIRAEAVEVASLLSSTIYLQVIEAGGDGIAHICAGLIDSSNHSIRLLNDRWRFSLAEPVDIVLATIGMRASRVDFAALARAATCASRAVKHDGLIVLLTEAEPVLGNGMEMLRGLEEPATALKLLSDKKPDDMPTAFAWASACEQAHLYLASGLRPETVEEIFATPILSPGEVQRLVDLGGRCLVLPDAEKSLVVVE